MEPRNDAAISPATAPPRSLAPDLARGFMLALIALANVSWHLWGRESGISSAHLLEGTWLDKTLQAVMVIAVDSRSYPLFAFLFGYGMVQFFRSRTDRGIAEPVVRRMLRRRHGAMILFGLVHAALLFMGDVLGAYGLTGLILVWIFFRRRDRTLAIWASVLGALLMLGALLGLLGGVMALTFAPESLPDADTFTSPQDVTAGAATYGAAVLGRLASWVPLTLVQAFSGAIPLCILLGWLAARHRLLDAPREHLPRLRRLAVAGVLIGWAGGVPSALVKLGVLPVPPEADWMLMGLSSATGVCAGVGYAAVFALIAARWQESPPLILRAVAAVGRRSLTFYLWQSVVFAVVFSAWALGVGGWASTSVALLIALLTWAASIPLAWLLERRGARGPAEVLLRRLTYGRHDHVVQMTGGAAAPPPSR